MSAHLTPKQLAKLELLYKGGEKIDSISHRLRIGRRAIFNHAAKNGWEHGESKQEYTQKLIVKEEEKLLETDLQRAENLRENYLKKVNMLENMMSATLRALGTTPDEIRAVKKVEADRVFAIMKNLKISSEISQMHYESSRKALGLDQKKEEDELELLPININVTEPLSVVEEEEDNVVPI